MHFKKLKPALRIVAIMAVSVILVSCSASKKQRAAENLSEVLCGNYECEMTYSFSTDKSQYSGKASVAKNGYVTRLDILSPEPFAGLGIEYNVKGLPDSVAIHFSGMSASLPENSVAKINPVASLFADDFASALCKLSKESLTEYRLDDTSGICASLSYSGADITLYFSNDGNIPYALEYSGNGISAQINFDVFKPFVPDA